MSHLGISPLCLGHKPRDEGLTPEFLTLLRERALDISENRTWSAQTKHAWLWVCRPPWGTPGSVAEDSLRPLANWEFRQAPPKAPRTSRAQPRASLRFPRPDPARTPHHDPSCPFSFSFCTPEDWNVTKAATCAPLPLPWGPPYRRGRGECCRAKGRAGKGGERPAEGRTTTKQPSTHRWGDFSEDASFM